MFFIGLLLGVASRLLDIYTQNLGNIFRKWQYGYCSESCFPYTAVQKQIYCSEEKELTKAEYTRLCKTAEKNQNKRLSLIIQTICGTGIRVSELQFITVEAVKSGEATVSCKAKTRSVFIVKNLQKNCLTMRRSWGLKAV
jgi:integrase